MECFEFKRSWQNVHVCFLLEELLDLKFPHLTE